MSENGIDKNFIRRWLQRELSEEEIAQLKEEKGIVPFVEGAEQLSPPRAQSREEAWASLSHRIEAEAQVIPTTPVRSMRRRPVLAAMAAAIALLIAGYFFWPQSTHTIYTAAGNKESQFLPDGSEVILNAQSTLSFDPNEWDQSRGVFLEGEAYIKVKKGSTFSVKTPLGVVQVLGTEFNVFARGQRLDVACFTGKVAVETADAKTVLTPGSAAQLDDSGTLSTYQFNAKSKAAWKKGEFYFEKVPFKFVIQELERQFDVRVNMPSTEGRTYTGYFTNQNLEEALEMVCLPMGLQFSLEDKTHIRLFE